MRLERPGDWLKVKQSGRGEAGQSFSNALVTGASPALKSLSCSGGLAKSLSFSCSAWQMTVMSLYSLFRCCTAACSTASESPPGDM